MTQPQNWLEQLIAQVAEGVGDAVLRKIQEAPVIKPRLYSVEDAAKYLGRTKGSIENMVHLKRIPCVRLDSRLYFDVQDLDRWIEAGKEKPNGQEA